MLVPKADGWRFCVDYRKLNAVTKKDSYPLPLIQDIFDRLEGATIFTTLDLKSGYWQIPVAEQDRPKTAFVCPSNGLFHFRRLFQSGQWTGRFSKNYGQSSAGPDWKMLLCVHR